jgi:hypothetical protein
MRFRFGRRPPVANAFSDMHDALLAAESAGEAVSTFLVSFDPACADELPLAEVRTARSPRDLIEAATKAGAVILAVLEKDAKLRELYTDLLHKFAYLTTVSDALIKLLGQIGSLDKAKPQQYLEDLSRLIREFLAVEASFAEHKKLDSWNRGKSVAAERLNAKQFAWLSAFYMNFSVFTALATTAGSEAAGILDELAKLLAAGGSDKPVIVKGFKLAFQAVRCVRRILNALTQLLKALAKA